MPSSRTVRTLGTTDFILGTVLATVLFTATACGGTPASVPASAPSSSMALESIPAASTNTQDADADPTPLDGDTAPDAGNASLADKNQPSYGATAAAVLATLPVKGRAPKTGYSREEFGPAWADVDRNGCDTRNDILERDLSATTFKPGTHDCIVLTGALADPYTASTINFVRGAASSSVVQIDHVVALNDAWQKGAQQLSAEQRMAFANDPLNLLAVDGPSNQQKGAGDAATWLPSNSSFRCDYVARQISVKATYSLWVTPGEHDAMAKVLTDCSNVLVPTSQAAPLAPPATPAVAPAIPEQAAVAPYPNCKAVRAAGAAPIYAGQPGFQAKLDGDGDGVACE